MKMFAHSRTWLFNKSGQVYNRFEQWMFYVKKNN
jgi:hypothetical protein